MYIMNMGYRNPSIIPLHVSARLCNVRSGIIGIVIWNALIERYFTYVKFSFLLYMIGAFWLLYITTYICLILLGRSHWRKRNSATYHAMIGWPFWFWEILVFGINRWPTVRFIHLNTTNRHIIFARVVQLFCFSCLYLKLGAFLTNSRFHTCCYAPSRW